MTESPREPDVEPEDAEERPQGDAEARGGSSVPRVERAVNLPPERR